MFALARTAIECVYIIYTTTIISYEILLLLLYVRTYIATHHDIRKIRTDDEGAKTRNTLKYYYYKLQAYNV